MLAEFLLYLLTPATRHARKQGYLRASIDLWALAHQCRKSWRVHEAACHGIILQAVEACLHKRTVVVLGSGLLRDIPYEQLAHHFEHVVLIDVVHPLPSRIKTAFMKNVTLLTLDLNGERVINSHAQSPLAFLYARDDVDLVISANVLSQLALEPVQNMPDDASDEQVNALAKRLIKAHYDDLKAFTCPVTLLTDTLMRTYDHSQGEPELIEEHDLLYGLELPPPDQSWIWHIAPLGVDGKYIEREHVVCGYLNI